MKKSLVLTTLICCQLIISACSLPAGTPQDDSPSIPSIESPPTLVPSAGGLLDKGNITAANSEVITVKMASQAYNLNTGIWPRDSSNLVHDGYLDKEPEETYTFNINDGTISGVTSAGRWITAGFIFDVTTQQWK